MRKSLFSAASSSSPSPTSSSSPVGRRSVLAAAAGAGAAVALGATAHSARAATQSAAGSARPVKVTVTARPAAEAERLRLGQALRGSEFQPTGLYVPAGTALSFTVQPDDGPLPTLWIGAWDYYGEVTEPRSYPLTAGANTVTDPHGGPVYLTLTGNGERAGVVFRSGAVPMPVFTLGCTSEADYQHQLDTLTTSPYVELHAPHTIMTLTRDGALLYRGEDHAALLGLVETIIDSHARISGLDGSKPVHRRKAGPYHFTEVSKVPTGVGAYATHGYNGFPRAYLDRATTVEGLRTRGWGLYHELGHLHQQMAYKPGGLTEVTVNIYSLAAQRTLRQPSNLLTVDATTGLTYFQSAQRKFGTAGLTYEKSFGAYEKLVPLRQLELAFGDDFWPRLHKLVREENPQSDYTETDKRYRALATYSSRVAGYDLTDFYVNTWAFPIDATGKAELAALQLPKPPVDPSTLTD
ncbi:MULTISPECIES: M60 family metallopeptidase [unclassified Streptomyces]|uniref:M60 family metallopeptidase n=1 Tax=unclassified Streptomyces TaxID=2593676 RepID=UPI002E81B991|nr:M60 family metallopeptidase [Streptomyces sp. NBC_00562]WTC78299.1 M60 family metallopeptidase [Streptomyces sp. NBC_01653]WTD37153.1 M60 family metallopeptidase [Streptomyces sp. NBC_01643]WTD92562.1 M60 family metallopeptidase [Streptomyces sp. NBC_01637]WUC23617.1 M60 family metallopeptidase [Streptomyces sp. NBC_00562]